MATTPNPLERLSELLLNRQQPPATPSPPSTDDEPQTEEKLAQLLFPPTPASEGRRQAGFRTRLVAMTPEAQQRLDALREREEARGQSVFQQSRVRMQERAGITNDQIIEGLRAAAPTKMQRALRFIGEQARAIWASGMAPVERTMESASIVTDAALEAAGQLPRGFGISEAADMDDSAFERYVIYNQFPPDFEAELRTQRETARTVRGKPLSPEEARNKLFINALDFLTFAGGLGISRYAGGILAAGSRAAPLAGREAIANSFLARSAVRVLQGAGIGLQPFFGGPETGEPRTITEDIVDRLETSATIALLNPAFGAFGEGVTAINERLGGFLKRPAESLFKELRKAVSPEREGGLNNNLLLHNTIPRLFGRLGATIEALDNTIRNVSNRAKDAVDDVLGGRVKFEPKLSGQRFRELEAVRDSAEKGALREMLSMKRATADQARRTARKPGERLPRLEMLSLTPDERLLAKQLGKRVANKRMTSMLEAGSIGGGARPTIGQAVGFLQRAVQEELKATAPELRKVLLEELNLLRGSLQIVRGRLRRVEGFDGETVDAIINQANSMHESLLKDRIGVRTINQLFSVRNNLSALFRQANLAEVAAVGESPLITLKRIILGPPAVTAGQSIGERLLGAGGRAFSRQGLQLFILNFFTYTSGLMDTMGNTLRLGSNIGSRAVLDTKDFLTGAPTAGERLAPVINAIRNRRETKEFVTRMIRPTQAAAVEVGESLPAGTFADRAFELILFGGPKGKALADTFIRRFAARIRLNELVRQETKKRGLVGLERELLEKEFLANSMRGLDGVLARDVVDTANRAAFIEPNNPTIARMLDSSAFKLFLTPFGRFAVSWAHFVSRFTPIGSLQLFRRARLTGRLPTEAIEGEIIRQFAGLTWFNYFDENIYDSMRITPFGSFYVDADTKLEAFMSSPLTDSAMIVAIARGDAQRAAMLFSQSGMMGLGIGAMSELMKVAGDMRFLGSASATERAKLQFSKFLENFVPGKAAILNLTDMFLPARMQPTGLPFVERIPGVSLPQPRVGGGVEPSRFPLTPMLQKAAKQVGIDASQLRVPRALGAIVTGRDLNDAERVVRIAEKKTGRQFSLLSARKEIADIPGGKLKIAVEEIKDPEIRLEFLMLKNEYLGARFAGLPDSEVFLSKNPAQMEAFMDYWIEKANEYAARKIRRRHRISPFTGEAQQTLREFVE